MERYVCIHGHFYQPPRENPWLEAVELQDSAYPYHDWNERITAECYAANAASRILDDSGAIERIVNNYSKISFNFGPTLLSWMAERAPETYAAILDADQESRTRFSGHGAALAQAYNHMILPLANGRDRKTQVLWGIVDFTHRFGRKPEGMWLPEAAVDVPTLESLVDAGIRFTVLAPRQARRMRRPGARTWRDVSGSRVDPSRAYKVLLPSGRNLSVFFYDGPISQAVAFEGLLSDGSRFADRLLGAFSDDRDWPQLLHIASDGESYGHHHRHGDMALAFALRRIETGDMARLTVYGEYLERHPPNVRAEIIERSSWSCIHGVDRWERNCGCNTGGHPDWNQEWRTPLRAALDNLRDDLAPRFEERAREYLRDPWAARDDYIQVILDRSPESRSGFCRRHELRPLAGEDEALVMKLLEMQRHLLLMYTSCGWFFDELSGVEAVQVMQYAGRAVQLSRQALGYDPEAAFLECLAQAKSNIPEHGDGAQIYSKWVRPAEVDLRKVAAHYAISSLFETFNDRDRIYCYEIERRDAKRHDAGHLHLLVGNSVLTSRITTDTARLSYGVLHFGDHIIQAGVREFGSDEEYEEWARVLQETFVHTDLPEVLRILGQHFEGDTYSVRSLFRDAQRRILQTILTSTLEEVESGLRHIYEAHAPLIRFLGGIGTPAPKVLQVVAEYVLNSALLRALGSEAPSPEQIRGLLDSAAQERIELDPASLPLAFGRALERLAERLLDEPHELPVLENLESLIAIAAKLPFPVDIWRTQNLYYRLAHRHRASMERRSGQVDDIWAAHFTAVSRLLGVGPAQA